jgi:hypothetical protein
VVVVDAHSQFLEELEDLEPLLEVFDPRVNSRVGLLIERGPYLEALKLTQELEGGILLPHIGMHLLDI